MMEIVVDISKIKDLNCGLGQLSYHLYRELYKLDSDLFFYQERNNANHTKGRFLSKKKWHRVGHLYRPKCRVWHAVHQDVDVYPVSSRIKKILTIQDLNFLKETDNAKKKRKYLKSLQKKIDRAHTVTFISHFTKDDVCRHLDLSSKRMQVIYPGYCLGDEEPERPKQLPASINNYIFCIGTVVPKKNYQLVVEMAKKRKDLTFVIAGTLFHDHAKSLIRQVLQDKLEDRVFFLGEVSESEKRFLYENATIFLHPSLLEGFGLPVIEALAVGVPVVSSNACSLPEVLGGFGHLFDPHSAEEALMAIDDCLASSTQPEELISYAQKFSWEKCAKEYYQLYKKLSEEEESGLV